MKSTVPVARRYARALLDIGAERGALERYREQLSALADLYERSPDFRAAMLNPGIKLAERKALLSTIAERVGLDPVVKNLANVLLDNERIKHIGDIALSFERMADKKAGRVRATITTARAIDGSAQDRLKRELMRLTGARAVVMTTEVDPSILGGVVARVGGVVFDGSVRHGLESMREAVLERT